MEQDLDLTQNPLSQSAEEGAVSAINLTTNGGDIVALLDQVTLQLNAGELPDKEVMARISAFVYKRGQTVPTTDTHDGVDEALTAQDEALDDDQEPSAEQELMPQYINVLTRYKELRNKQIEEQKRQHEANLETKKRLLERMGMLLTSTEPFVKINQEFRQIREEWQAIGDVPQNDKHEILKLYQEQMEQFYEIKEITNEFRELDFAKNKEKKTKLIELAQALDNEPDVIKAFNELQMLHDTWKETGPVAYEDREPMWAEFKRASTVINKKHQDHYTALREKEEENLVRKTELCQKLEGVAQTLPDTREGWRALMDQLTALKEEWRTIGFAPKKYNKEVYDRFRTTLNALYSQRRSFLKELSVDIEEKLSKYRELNEKAQALKDSTDWKKTAEKIMALQEQWKAVGALGTRVSEATKLWHSFSEACNTFFKRRQLDFKERNSERTEALKAKREIISQLEALKEQGEVGDALADKLAELQEKWQSLGHVPNKNKDEINDAYYSLVRELSRKGRSANNKAGGAKQPSFTEDLSTYTEAQLSDESRKLSRIISRVEEEIKQYEKNLWFFQPTGAETNNPLAKQVLRKIELLKADLKRFADRIADIRELQQFK